jgi:serine protease Do
MIGRIAQLLIVATFFSLSPIAYVCPVEADDVQVGPRALSRAFRNAAKKASPSVVTILSFGQNMDETDTTDSRPSQPRIGRNNRSDDSSDSQPDGEGNEPGTDENEQLDGQDQLDEQAEPDSIEPRPSPLRSEDGSSLPITGLGSGVIITDDGRVITNNHVIAGAKKVLVQLPDQTEVEAFDIHGDPDSDVATFRIKLVDPIMPATLGDSDSIEIGDWVLAIGSPFKLEATVSAGIISAKNRAIARITRGRLLQTDAAINPGNSGGPLIDLDGDVVAINTAIATRNGGYQGIGFAIPINQAKWIADELAEHGRVRRAAIGVQLAELNKKIATKLNLPIGSGIAVYQVIEGSAAAKAGMKPLDVITDFAGEPVRRANDLQEVVEKLPIGSTQTVRVMRNGEPVELQVQLAPLEDPTDVPGTEKTSDSDDGQDS